MLNNPIFLIFLSIFLGLTIGKIKIFKFKLGVSGTLFTGLILSWLSSRHLTSVPTSLINGLNSYFKFSLILFVSSIGLIAGKDIKKTFKIYGLKFILLGFIITSTGFLLIFLTSFITNFDNFHLLGLFSGALTSSPGLATALENFPNNSKIIFGYSIGYVPGVLAVIFSTYIIPVIFKNNSKKEFENFSRKDFKISEQNPYYFDFLGYSLIVILGLIIGNIKINVKIFDFSLGITGGILISSLFFGSIEKIWIFNFKFNKQILKIIQNFGLLLFLSTVGLKSGYYVINALSFDAFLLMILSFVIAMISITVGLLFGKFIFKINTLILTGSITGGMTSTPGLAAAIDSTNSEEVILGYGATYPFALIGMVIFNKILSYLFLSY
ncbi:aspartate-alanine antiporter-like transporter [Thermosipho atlanticus]|uniref:Putative transport protein n=1 Tax=Thermosipho atlanticus DSM 15807 TaxID=1123380 RepID=A0A1M5SKI6_9BACT|nr:hypothetical protein [Thermosipho atlanticus]SHH39054.1 putative transport protein [Thermosipho atlanticus DSM 15807]